MRPLLGGRFQRPYSSPDSIKPRQSTLPLGAVELERGISPNQPVAHASTLGARSWDGSDSLVRINAFLTL